MTITPRPTHAMDSPEPRFWLSILVPVYQVQAYLQACADSILVQADAGVELVFVDDASPDGCADILSNLLAAYPDQVRVLRHDHNQGISAARNTLLQAARGRYIWFIDSDDLLERNAIAELKAIIQATSPDWVMCDFRQFEEGRDASRHTRHAHMTSFQGPKACFDGNADALLTGLFKTGQFHPWSKVIRAACWPSTLRFPVGRIFEDLAVYPRLALHIQSFQHVPHVWIAYRQRPGSALSGLSEKRIDDWMEALVGYPQDLAHHAPELAPDTRFEIAHFCTRTFLRAIKRQVKLKTSDTASWLPHFANQWQRASPLSYRELMHNYFVRGYWLRALQLAYWVHQARKAQNR